ncbi:NAD(P)-dependent oxidoreductase [Arthrobacter sp. MYb211]|uniref:SDR family oxidoreductase n=1 Tax=Micrococcaceae TaxID=1268 RepID=UPI000BB9552D|nr:MULTISPECIES: SDR family oxidoreductase [Micrococcaceae]PCC30521.1 short-chain dehydrogenase [Glutamicibacter sp. BW80]PRA11631.1 NAD(P)-dependent oxidoreductase [Arthrobacter sp. MYb221]PRC07866.1 NAD(P)-dependent oxidoreductase [Arthrobacter sp. MYb211]
MPSANMPTSSILITGAGTGIGRATARLLLAQGWNVVLAGRTEQTLQEAAQGHGNALVVQADVSSAEEVRCLFAKATEHFGRLDTLFNNAGTFGPAVSIDELSAEDWEKVCQVNLTGAMNCAREAFKHMKLHGGGRIINNGSISAQVPRPRSVAYAVTKHAITGLTKSIELDGRPFGICASQIDIGNTASDIMDELGTSQGALQADGSRKVEPTFDLQQAAQAVAFLANSPLTVSVNQLTITAAGMPYIGRG